MKKIIFSFAVIISLLTLGEKSIYATEEVTNDITLEEVMNNIPEYSIEKYDSMTFEEKEAMETNIAEKYQQDDILSDEDALFLVNLANEEKQASNPMLRAGKTQKAFNKSLTKFSTKVTLSGTMYQDIAPVLGTSSYRGNVTLTLNSGSLKKVALNTHHTAYALLGWNGKIPSVGQVYKGSVSMSKTSSLSSTKMDKTTRYNGVLVFSSTMYTQATVTNSKGNVFTVTSDNWTRVH